MPTWSNKPRNPASITDEEILTPDLQEILVGADEDQVLLYQEGSSIWSNKSAIISSFTLRQKRLFYTYLLLQSGDYFGSQADQIIYTQVTTQDGWQNKQKV